MADKVKKIKEWISKEQDGLMDAQGNFEFPEHEGAYHILCNLDTYIDSLQEEPVSEDLEEAAYYNCIDRLSKESIEDFKAGAKWKKKQMLKNAISAELYSDGMFTPLIGVKDKEKLNDIKFGDKVKLIIIKDK